MRHPLPGQDAHLRLASHSRRLETDIPQHVIEAAVLLLLYPGPDDWHTILIERNRHLHDKHSGQISLPGGKFDPEDNSLEDCAIREAYEEIGLDSKKVQILGRLTDLYIPVSGFKVTPIIAYVRTLNQLVRQPSEVASILRVSLSHLLLEENLKYTTMQLQENLVLPRVPYYDIDGRVVWGATAMILSEFLTISREIFDQRSQVRSGFDPE